MCFPSRPNDLLQTDASPSNLSIGRRSRCCERATRHPPTVGRRRRTLVTHDKVLTEATKAAAAALHDAGLALAITSGRPPRGMSMRIEPLNLQGAIAGFNGGVFVNPDLSVIESHTLDLATVRQALEESLMLGSTLRMTGSSATSTRPRCTRDADGNVRRESRGILHRRALGPGGEDRWYLRRP